MLRSIALAISTLTALSACQSAPVQTTAPSLAPQQPPSTVEREDIDPFTLAIETGRWRVIVDRAREGVRNAPSDDRDEDNTLRIDRQLKSGALELLLLRNDACANGLASARICTFIDWPEWTLEPPRAGTDLVTLQRRSEWLGAAIGDLSSIGCDAGRTATGDERFCAVE